MWTVKLQAVFLGMVFDCFETCMVIMHRNKVTYPSNYLIDLKLCRIFVHINKITYVALKQFSSVFKEDNVFSGSTNLPLSLIHI